MGYERKKIKYSVYKREYRISNNVRRNNDREEHKDRKLKIIKLFLQDFIEIHSYKLFDMNNFLENVNDQNGYKV